MPLVHLGDLHDSGLMQGRRRRLRGIIALQRWAVEKLASTAGRRAR
jgi:hypothetical protein